jgi:response regulator RpfG family c-di-GMP phosphodiesterase
MRELDTDKRIPEQRRTKVIMTTALSDSGKIIDSFTHKCDAYLIKPIDKNTFSVRSFALALHKEYPKNRLAECQVK